MATSSSCLSFLFLFALCFIRQVIGNIVGGVDDLVVIRQVTDDRVLSAERHFSAFVRRFGKTYSGPNERAYRFSIFKTNLRRARHHQKLDPTAVHGITQFSDLTEDEFGRRYLGLGSIDPFGISSSTKKAALLPTDDLPDNFDWREHGAVTPVNNQGSCGSCWSFSTTGALEGANFLATGKLVSLSEQQLVDCDHECDPSERSACDAGCNGGLMTNAFHYAMKAGVLEREDDYPYSGTDKGTCKFDKNKIAASVSNYSTLSVDEDQIAANLVKHGPLAEINIPVPMQHTHTRASNFELGVNTLDQTSVAVGINAVFMQTYIGGVSCPYICSRRLDHGVLLVGYGAEGYSPLRLKEKPYWIIKNSWGEGWGEQGYYKICRGHNVCGVDSMVSTVAAVHVQ